MFDLSNAGNSGFRSDCTCDVALEDAARMAASMMRVRVASSIVGVVGGKVKTFSDAGVGDGLLERRCWRRRYLACGDK